MSDPAVLERIRALAIPPAWTDVWICPWPNGHIQATGHDAKGRRQYRYHDEWRARRDAEKFEHMIVFAQALPNLRAVVAQHLAEEGLTRSRVLACATRLLDVGFFRIGSEGYAEENDTFGLATMRKKHVTVSGDEVTFDYIAKSGKRRVQSVVDAEVAALVTELKGRRGGGYELLAYRDSDGEWRDIKSTDINTYLKEQTGEDITAKDFRTWHATVLCAVGLAKTPTAASRAAAKRSVVQAVKDVADYLGNTPSVCKGSYIDPRIIDRYEMGTTLEAAIVASAEAGADAYETRQVIEDAVLELLVEKPSDESLAA
jgi:DNA topoisomerase IB